LGALSHIFSLADGKYFAHIRLSQRTAMRIAVQNFRKTAMEAHAVIPAPSNPAASVETANPGDKSKI